MNRTSFVWLKVVPNGAGVGACFQQREVERQGEQSAESSAYLGSGAAASAACLTSQTV